MVRRDALSDSVDNGVERAVTVEPFVVRQIGADAALCLGAMARSAEADAGEELPAGVEHVGRDIGGQGVDALGGRSRREQSQDRGKQHRSRDLHGWHLQRGDGGM